MGKSKNDSKVTVRQDISETWGGGYWKSSVGEKRNNTARILWYTGIVNNIVRMSSQLRSEREGAKRIKVRLLQSPWRGPNQPLCLLGNEGNYCWFVDWVIEGESRSHLPQMELSSKRSRWNRCKTSKHDPAHVCDDVNTPCSSWDDVDGTAW